MASLPDDSRPEESLLRVAGVAARARGGPCNKVSATLENYLKSSRGVSGDYDSIRRCHRWNHIRPRDGERHDGLRIVDAGDQLESSRTGNFQRLNFGNPANA